MTGARVTALVRNVLRGAAGGAAGTTALDAATYLDMALRGRPSSSTPQDVVEKVSDTSGIDVPGQGETRDNRVHGIAPLMGIVTGVGVGALLGLARAVGWRPSAVTEVVAAAGLALVGANAPMTALGVTDPRSWSTTDWAADVIPHLVYGAVTVRALRAMTEPAR
jgi:hypothetical protein